MAVSWQSKCVHSRSWLPNLPNVEELLPSLDASDAVKQEIVRCADGIVTTCYLAVLPDGSDIGDAPAPHTDPHICSQVNDFNKDLAYLVATCQMPYMILSCVLPR